MSICWLIVSLIKLSITETTSSYTFQFNIQPKEPSFGLYLQNNFISESDLCVGTPLICRKTQFDPSTHISYFVNGDKSSPYNLSISSSTVSYKTTFVFQNDKMVNGILFRDNATIGDMAITDFSLFSPIELLSYARSTSVIGLQIRKTIFHFYPFINYIYTQNIISHLGYGIEYISNTKGKVTIGKNIESPTKEEDKALEIQLNVDSENIPFIKADIVTIGEAIILFSEGEYNIRIDESFSFIQIPFKLKQDLVNAYHLQGKGCKVEIYEKEKGAYDNTNTTYYYYLCDKNLIDEEYIQSLPALNFHFGSDVISLKPEDLFSNFSEYDVIFNIVLHKSEESDQIRWIIGEPILKHYKTDHDYNEYIFKLFVNQLKNQNGSKASILLFVIIGANLILLCGLGINLFFILFINQKPFKNI